MKSLILFFILTGLQAKAQRSPAEFIGHWEGQIQWFQTGKPEPKVFKMQLRVFPADTAGQYTWQLIYGDTNQDDRPYLLKAVDSVKGHWVVDEKNSILLDQYYTGNRLCGSFSVGKNQIANCYWREGDSLIVEFLTSSTDPVAVTGGVSEDIPEVKSFMVKGYQRAVLRRKNSAGKLPLNKTDQ